MGTQPEVSIEVQDQRRLRFCQVDNELMRASELGPYSKLIYAILCGYANINTLSCHPKLSTLAKDAGISKPTVVKALKELADKGVLTIVHQTDSAGRDKVNQYIIKDWRAEQANSRTAVNDVYPSSKPALPQQLTTFTPAVNDVYTKEKDTKERNIKEKDIKDSLGQVATATAPTPEKPLKKKTVKAKDEDTDPRVKTAIDRIQAIFGPPYLGFYKQAPYIKQLLKAKYTEDEIVGCWQAIWEEQSKGDFIPMTWLFDRIAAYRQNGGKLAQRGQNNGQLRSNTRQTRDLPPIDGDTTDYYAGTLEIIESQRRYREEKAAAKTGA